MTRVLVALVVAHALVLGAPAEARDAVPTVQDPIEQARAVKLAEQLRCLVCQNQTIADSNADLAVDLRAQVREQIAAGRSDREIIEYMTARYGDFVLYRPPLKASTLLLWGGPALMLMIGSVVLVAIVRERRRRVPPIPLTPEERERAEALIADAPPRDGP